MIFGCICTPIFINTVVVFVRLYWFEKRFQHVVLEAQKYRRTKERSRTKSQAKEDNMPDLEVAQKGVGDRKIVVMHPGERTMSVAEHHLPQKIKDESDAEVSSGAVSSTASSFTGAVHDPPDISKEPRYDPNQEKQEHKSSEEEEPAVTHPQRAITFADEVDAKALAPPRRQSSDLEQGLRRTPEQHITFVENQRKRKDKGTLYIPGPRDFEEGHGPEAIEDEDGNELSRVATDGNMKPARRGSDREEPGDEHSRRPLRKRLTNKLSLEDAGTTFTKARLGVITRFRHPAQHDGTDDDAIEKFPEPQRVPTTPATPTSLRKRGRASTFATFMSSKDDDPNIMPYLSYQATIGRNSAFVDLTEEQREELGGIEYRALKTLATILVIYFVGFHLLGMVCLTPWITREQHYANIVREDGVNPVWWGFFTPASLFNDLGLTLTPDSMESFSYAVYPLLLGSFLIIIGNTGFPCMLRFIIWVSSICVPKYSGLWEELRFLLDHPRRCFTLLFPSSANWWLFWVLVFLNVVDLVFFIILDVSTTSSRLWRVC